MSNSIIPVPAPVGTNLQSFQNTIGANVVQAEAVTVVDSSGNEKGVIGNPVKVDGSNVTQPISGTVGISGTITLATGQGVELLDSGGTNKASISSAGAIKVDGSAVTQPVSGTFFQATQPVSATSLPFPSGAGSILSGQGGATSTAGALASNSCKKVTIKNNVSSAATIYIGPSGVTASTGLELVPGDSVSLEISNTNLISVITASGTGTFSWLAVN